MSLDYDAAARAMGDHLIAKVRADLRKQVMTVVEKEVEAVIDEATRNMVARMAEVRHMDTRGIMVQVAVNGVPTAQAKPLADPYSSR